MRRLWALMQPDAVGDGGSGGGAAADDTPPPPAPGEAGGSSGGGGAGGGEPPTSSHPAGDTRGIALTDAQRQAVLEGRPLVLAEGQYGAAVRDEIGRYKRQRREAEKQLADITTAQEAEQRTRLEEQEQYKTLYEGEKTKREQETAKRQELSIRSALQLAAVQKGVVDPHAAYLLAKELPGFAALAIDDDGQVTGTDELIDTLLEAKPFLKGTSRQTTVGGPSSPATGDPELKPATDYAGARANVTARLQTGT